MRKSLLLVLLVSITVQLAAQQPAQKALPGKITGKVIDSASKQNIDYATISVFAAGKTEPITGATTDTKGAFKIESLAPGTYRLEIDFIGYGKKTITGIIISTTAQVFNAGTISLVKTAAELKGVTVTTQAKLIDNRIDKMVFNAEKDLTSVGGVATDVLKKVPQVTVDIDGNVELAGTSSIRFLINGKPSSAFGSNIADVLQSIPASQVKSIEVITNPGAKYDAQGLGGIINIILKQDKTRGINGNLSLTAGTLQQNGSFNFNARNGNFGINAFISGNGRLAATTRTSSARNSFDSAAKEGVVFQQDGHSKFARHGIESGIGFDWTLNKKNSLTGSVNLDHFGGSGHGIIGQLQTATDASGGLLSSIASISNSSSSFRFRNIDANLDYKRTFNKEDQEFELEVNSSFGKSRGMADNTQLLMPQDSLYYGINSVNPGKENETQVAADYTQPLAKDVKLGVGAKLSARDISSTSDVLSFRPLTKDYATDLYLSNNLTYHEKVYALYTELNFPVANWFDAKIGGRYERTDINAFFSNAQHQANTPGYNTFVPSIFFMKKLPNNQSIKLSYSKRIERPDYRDLNPFINTTDPKNLQQGNPSLRPEIGNRVELSYNRDLGTIGSFMVTAFYRANKDDIQPYVKYYTSFAVGDTAYSNVSVSTAENIGVEKNMGVNLFVDVHPVKRLALRSNIFAFYRRTINAVEPGRNSKSFNYRFNINATYQFTGTLAAEFFGNFNSARHEAQGRYPSFTSYSMAIRKQFWNKKGSLALTANNVFSNTIRQETILTGSNFTSDNVRYVPFRSIGVNFTWKFGKLEFKKDKDQGGDNTPAPEG